MARDRCQRCGLPTGHCEVVPEPDTSPHFARLVCPDCRDAGHSGFVGWVPRPRERFERQPRRGADRDLYRRHGKAYCELCLRTAEQARRPLNVHHVIEYAKGGASEPGNLWTLCEGCHRLVHWVRQHHGRSAPGEGNVGSDECAA